MAARKRVSTAETLAAIHVLEEMQVGRMAA
jgi:hypothetical protein